jgi:hypothetical protein
MPRLKMLTIYASPVRTIDAGQVADFDDDEAEALVTGGFATLPDPVKPPVPTDGPGEAGPPASSVPALAAATGTPPGQAGAGEAAAATEPEPKPAAAAANPANIAAAARRRGRPPKAAAAATAPPAADGPAA